VPAPVILFDGVCNLCHAAVAWVLERDRHQVFRFASLQSNAAREVLTAAGLTGDLPDSVILVDEQGVHTRSDAAMRIARRLGFPWSLAVLAQPLPGFLRDAGYAWVARNRYRWFGRRDTCAVPTPELASRFLDAGERIAVAPLAPAPPATLGLFELLVYSYLFIYIFPFPFGGDADVLGAISERYEGFWRNIIQWVATNILHVNASILPGGSGDTTYNYVETFTDAVLAFPLALTLWTWSRRRPVTATLREGARVYVRYFLAAVMLSYGWHKLFPLQMPTPGPDRLISSFADTSPMGLLWTFLGASPAYQMLCGFVEVLGGAFLLFRRTTLLGALVSAFAMAQVVALNFCYDVPVKLFSSHLLLLSIFLLAPHLPRLFSFLVLGLPAQPAPVRPLLFDSAWTARTRWTLKTLAIAVFAVLPVFSGYQSMQRSWAEEAQPLHGLYAVATFESENKLEARRWTRVGISASYNRIGIQKGDGSVRRYTYKLNPAQREFTLTFGQQSPVLKYTEPSSGELRLEGIFDGAPTIVLLKRQPASANLLMTRGFHWVNEFPFNR
jgi:predicted DCC family thiol-disulfide oxidoreductase YuxK